MVREPLLKTSPPVDLWGSLAAKAARLELAVGALSLAVVVLAGTVGWQVYRGQPIHYVPPGGSGVSQPGVIPDTLAADYASRWVQSRSTFTPATIKAVHAELAKTLHPSLSVAFKVQAEREAAMVKEYQIAAQVAITSATVTSRAGAAVQVKLEAVRTVWIGGHQVREEPVQADVTVVPWLSQGHPAGLAVSKVAMSPALSASGQ